MLVFNKNQLFQIVSYLKLFYNEEDVFPEQLVTFDF